MNKLFTLILIVFSLTLEAQVENGLQFDGIDDKVTVSNASALIANSPNISLSFWVNPQNPAPSFPDMDGFCGFRNDNNCDFYIVHTNSNVIEARFRNSAGTTFDIDTAILQLNAWQHFVLTYDGSYLRLYYNGAPADSVAATGVITSNIESLNIGNLFYGITNFYLEGTLDEVSLWNITLQPAEIECIYKSYIDSTASGLQLYYKFNQGNAGVTNIGQDTLNPSRGNLFGVLSGFSYSGTLSNWVAGNRNFTSLTDFICGNTPYTFGSQTLNAPGIYQEAFTGSTGCDSIVQLTLYSVLSDSVIIYADSLRAFQASGVYQWLNCDNSYASIAGATNQSYSPAASGNYAVAISYNNCTDTSDCINFIHTAIENIPGKQFAIYPNPFTDQIIFSTAIENADVKITDVSGKTVFRNNNFSGAKVDVSYLVKGVYFISVEGNAGRVIKRVVRE